MSKNKTPIWKEWKFWTTIIELLLIIGLGIWNIMQENELNSLSRGKATNDILPYSSEDNSEKAIDKEFEATIRLTSNFEPAIPATIELDEIRRENNKVASGYDHKWISNTEIILTNDKEGLFQFNSTLHEKGSYQFVFNVYYNYNQELGLKSGELKKYYLDIIVG